MNILPSGLAIRRAAAEDIDAMLTIGERADRLFAEHGFPQIAALPPTPRSEFHRFVTDNDAWLALWHDVPAGFAVAGQAAGEYWLKEIAVDPARGRRGVGGALLSTVIDHARAGGASRVFLSTFLDVPFNRPFYERRGFTVIEPESASAGLREQFMREVPPGVDPATRTLMVWHS
ncbi:GNAT family N-acetyltransferase [Mesorhizobium australicum]|uniref:N-acetylglutamate synthase, GNAT family n=1 Tax=Mesorhizobium australicum TaxID=536018 RepID=A0A1X7MZ17_9HYPH|nr:GNAT family N-acetyltransferase [Mesorhizobium australicum]SMH29287.1 N-acetylglutamate synthase, GNAT family [Mesorhizobium australicum]